MKSRYLLVLLTVILASGCGGGGGGGSDPAPAASATTTNTTENTNADDTDDVSNTAPVITAGSTNAAIVEGDLVVTSVTASDADGDSLSFAVSGTDGQAFQIQSGSLQFRQAPDFDVPTDDNDDNIYQLTLSVTDPDGADDSVDLTVSVINLITGRVIDGPMAGSNLYLDRDGDFLPDDTTPIAETDEDGFYSFPDEAGLCNESIECPFGLLSLGGEDSQTGETLDSLRLYGPLFSDNDSFLTPLSTLLSYSDSPVQVLTRLGITASANDIFQTDTWAGALQADASARQTQRVNAQLAMLLQAAEALDSGGEGVKQLAQNFDALARDISMTSIADIEDLLVGLGDDDVVTAIAENLAIINLLISDETINVTGDEISTVLGVAQSKLVIAMRRFGAGEIDAASFNAVNGRSELVANAILQGFADTDGDGELDVMDDDIDGDGVPNESDAFAFDASESVDTDGDGTGNNADTDDDNDGTPDREDDLPLDASETLDTDKDGIGNNADTDDDGDGVADIDDPAPLDATNPRPIAQEGMVSLNLLPTALVTATGRLTALGNVDTYTIASSPQSGEVTLTNPADGEFSYETLAGITGPDTDSFTFTATNGGFKSQPATITVNLDSDPLLQHQWHLDNTGQNTFAANSGLAEEDINLNQAISEGATGKGVIVAVVDQGLEIAHADLSGNVVEGGSYHFGNNSTDPTNNAFNGDHGTSVAGIIASVGWNNLGGRGVAPGSSLKGFNALRFPAEANFIAALGGAEFAADVDVFNQSLGFSNSYDFRIDEILEAQYRYGVTSLRGGKGAIYIKSGGNGYNDFGGASCFAANSAGVTCQNISMDPENALPYNLSIGAITANGVVASYSSFGSAIWVTAPGGDSGDIDPGILTTDQSGCDRGYARDQNFPVNVFDDGSRRGHPENTNCDYTASFSGTSAAAPVVAGVVALMLEANSSLTWRDVKHLLAGTAEQVDPTIDDVVMELGDGKYIAEPGWTTNDAGYVFHNGYGFGRVDASAAVTAAREFSADTMGDFIETGYESSDIESPLAIPDNSVVGASDTITIANDLTIEAVKIDVDVSHDHSGDLGIELISPAGTRAVAFNARNGFGSSNDLDFEILVNTFYGESTLGDWTIKIVDAASRDEGTLNIWKIRFYGH